MQSKTRFPGDASWHGGPTAGGTRVTVMMPPQFGGRGPFNNNNGGGFGRGVSGGNNYKPFYNSPTPPPPPQLTQPPPQPNKYEILREAGRLAAEYLVSKGVLPPNSLSRAGPSPGPWPHPNGFHQGQPMQMQYQEPPVFFDHRSPPMDLRIGNPGPEMGMGMERRRFENEYSEYDGNYSRGRRNGGGGRGGKRKFGFYNMKGDWGRERERERERERSRGYSDSRSLDDDEEEVGAPGYRRQRREGNDEVGSSVSGVAGDGVESKVEEAMGESELEDTGSKASSSNVRKDVMEMEWDADTNKVDEDSKVSNMVVEQVTKAGDENKASNSEVEEVRNMQGLSMKFEEVAKKGAENKVLMNVEVEQVNEVHDNSAVGNAEVEHVENVESNNAIPCIVEELPEVLDAKTPAVDNDLHDNRGSLLKFGGFGKVPTKPRSTPGHRNAVPDQSIVSDDSKMDGAATGEATEMIVHEDRNDYPVTDLQETKNDSLDYQECNNPSTAGSQNLESALLPNMETSAATGSDEKEKSFDQHVVVEEIKDDSELLASKAVEGSSINCKGEMPPQDKDPQDKEMIESVVHQANLGGINLYPHIGAESLVAMEGQKAGQSNSFKICDLNLLGSPEVNEMHDLGHHSTAGVSSVPQNLQLVDFGQPMGNSSNGAYEYNHLPLGDKVVQVIDLEDDTTIDGGCDPSKSKNEMLSSRNEMMYPSMGNIMNSAVHADVLQDGYSLAISDYLGSDESCYPPMQADLQPEIGLNVPEGMTAMDDSIYASLSDIGFMEEVWDQQPQDYEKFF